MEGFDASEQMVRYWFTGAEAFYPTWLSNKAVNSCLECTLAVTGYTGASCKAMPMLEMAVSSLLTLKRENMAIRGGFTHLQYLSGSLTRPLRTIWVTLFFAKVIFTLQVWSLKGIHGRTLHFWRKGRTSSCFLFLCEDAIPHYSGKGTKCLSAAFKNITLFYVVIYHPGKPLRTANIQS